MILVYRAAEGLTIVSVQPAKVLRARCAASDAAYVHTQAMRLPASQRTAPCKQYLEFSRVFSESVQLFTTSRNPRYERAFLTCDMCAV